MKFLRVVVFFVLFCSISSYADDLHPLNELNFQLRQSAWVKTDSAEITINVNATVTKGNTVEVRDDILQKLSAIDSNVAWHVTQFQRDQDQSGLAKIVLSAEARVLNNAVEAVAKKVKELNRPGEKFVISAMNFTPSLKEIEETQAKLRQEIYKLVAGEIKDVNQIYTDQNYFLHKINFVSPEIRPVAFVKGLANSQATNLAVSRKITLMAEVTLSSVVPNSGD